MRAGLGAVETAEGAAAEAGTRLAGAGAHVEVDGRDAPIHGTEIGGPVVV